MMKHVQKITFIVCLLFVALVHPLQAVHSKANESVAPRVWFSLAKDGNTLLLKDLHKCCNININAKDEAGNTALFLSVKNGHLACANYLVSQGAQSGNLTKDRNYKNKELVELFGVSVIGFEIIKYVGCESGKNAFSLSIRLGYLDYAQWLIEKNPCRFWLSSAGYGELKCVKYLLEKGAYIDKQDYFLYTALHYSAMRGHLDVVKYLVQQGADINIIDANKNKPINYAYHRGHLDVIEYLKRL